MLDGKDLNDTFNESCVFGVTPLPDNMADDTRMYIMGDVFLRHFYSIYDFDNN